MTSNDDIEKVAGSVTIETQERVTLESLRDKTQARANVVPVPADDDPSDPYNWSAWRKNVLLLIVSLHAWQGPFSAAIVIPAYVQIAQEFSVSVNKATYLTSVQILFLGIFPIGWKAVSERIGRRPVYLLSALVAAACALGGAYCHSYGTLMTTRVFQAIFISPPLSMGASTVSEMFFAYEKGRKMGLWVLLVIIGPFSAPLVTSYLVQNRGWRTIFYLSAAIQLTLFFLHLLLGGETLRVRGSAAINSVQRHGEALNEKSAPSATRYHKYRFRVYSHKPFTCTEFLSPLRMLARPLVFLAVWSLTLPFAYVGVLMTVFTPQIFGPIYNLKSGQIGLQFIAQLIGAVLGEQIAGIGGDLLVTARAKYAGGMRVPEHRLLLAYPGFAMAIAGLMLWAAELQNATPGVWTIVPDVGSVIAVAGMEVLSSVCTTYAIESYQDDAADISAFLNIVRQTFAFVAPFYLPIPIESWGVTRACGLFSGLMGVACMMVVACDVYGPSWRKLGSP